MKLLKEKMAAFVKERNWDQYHNPKNLLLSLVTEVGELTEIFRWYTPEECMQVMNDPKIAAHVREEMADVFNNLLLLAMKFDIDLLEAAQDKLKINALKYPADQWKDRAFKEENRL
ncbi:nucleotide pyrophosphohydrolase [Simkania sp.]|uniref:nucleotide pyrophosphohydrolase n=1 Tax=Simkania sp. TaxID=34094 RepID=UPI003B51C675